MSGAVYHTIVYTGSKHMPLLCVEWSFSNRFKKLLLFLGSASNFPLHQNVHFLFRHYFYHAVHFVVWLDLPSGQFFIKSCYVVVLLHKAVASTAESFRVEKEYPFDFQILLPMCIMYLVWSLSALLCVFSFMLLSL